MDALSRLQTQVQLNTKALEAQRRTFDNLTKAVDRLSTCSSSGNSVLEYFTDTIARLESKVGEVYPHNGAAPLRLSSTIESPLEASQTHPPHPMQCDSSPGYPRPLRSPQYQTPPSHTSSRDSPHQPHAGTQATQPSQSSADKGLTSASTSTKRQRSEGVDNPMDTYRHSLWVPVGTSIITEEARRGETDRKDHDGEPTGEQQRRVAATPADFVRRKDDVMDAQGIPTVRHGSADYSQIAEAYADSKKTRWKPIRDADGTLLCKDGTPDMRSSSNKKRALQGEVPISV